jgi:hypothetical protein
VKAIAALPPSAVSARQPLRTQRAFIFLCVLCVLCGGAAGDAGIFAAPAPFRPTIIYPGQHIQSVVNARPPGSTFLLKAGVHRMQTVQPRDGDTFIGEPGTILSGARPITTFTAGGSYWVATNQFANGAIAGECEAGFPRCGYPEELFVDDQPLRHVDSLVDLAPGSWFFDRDEGRIYVGDDPTGRRAELSVTPTAFMPTGNDVVIRELTIEKYASPSQQAAISADGVVNWLVIGNEIRLNHGLGVRVATGTRVIGNRVHHNGQLGVGGTGEGVVIDGNEISFNNTAHFNPAWEAGGAKFTRTISLAVRSNVVHDNRGHGLWTDIDNINTSYESNRVEDNARIGVLHEISDSATIRGNVVRRNGFGFADWIWGAGILVAASRDVEVSDNVVEDNADGIGGVQQARGSGVRGPHDLENLWVHDNRVRMRSGWTGIVEDVGTQYVYTGRNNRFERNQYQLGALMFPFVWMDGERTGAEWRRFGQDVDGLISYIE